MSAQPYKPKADHPWNRSYKGRTFTDDLPAKTYPARPLKEFLADIIESWDTYQIPPAAYEDRNYLKLAHLTPDKQAEWLIGFLRKHWLSSAKTPFIDAGL